MEGTEYKWNTIFHADLGNQNTAQNTALPGVSHRGTQKVWPFYTTYSAALHKTMPFKAAKWHQGL